MNRIDRIFIKYVIWAIPAILAVNVWGSLGNPDHLSVGSGVIRVLWDGLGWILMIWVVVCLYLAIKTVLFPKFRNIILSKIAGMKERDEREELISGDAAKFAFLSTMGILLFFLFLSLITFSVGRHSEEFSAGEKTGYVSIGMNFNPLDLPQESIAEERKNDGTVYTTYSYSDLPISKTGLLLFLILWQIGCYKFVVRRRLDT